MVTPAGAAAPTAAAAAAANLVVIGLEFIVAVVTIVAGVVVGVVIGVGVVASAVAAIVVDVAFVVASAGAGTLVTAVPTVPNAIEEGPLVDEDVTGNNGCPERAAITSGDLKQTGGGRVGDRSMK